MLNYYPLWKYFAIALIFLAGIVYFIPSLYGKDPAICITERIPETNNQTINNTLLCQIKEILTSKKINYKSILLEEDKILIQFFYKRDQVQAYQELISVLLKKYQIFLCNIPTVPHWLSAIKARPIKLGLDLCGGIYFVLYINTETVLEKFQDQHIDIFKSVLHEKKIPYIKIYNVQNHGIEVNFQNSDDRNQAMVFLSKIDYDLIVHKIGINKLHIVSSERKKYAIHERAIRQNVNILQNRIRQELGINDPLIQRHGIDRIIIELPDIQNITKVKKILSTTASLEFRLVNSAIGEFEINNNLIPEDSEIKINDQGYLIPLHKRVIFSGDYITDANISLDEYNRPQVNISLDKAGSAIISNFTKNNIGKAMATLFVEYKDSGEKDSKGYAILTKHEKIVNIATIQSQLGNSFRIVGISNLNEARHLSLLLRMGTLAAPVYIEEERIIGPILGKRNITQGLTACILGILISVCFMVFWYHSFGLIASAALIANFMFIISIMSILPGIILTMPSIAGIILTLSVAIDANVLINERIKEEIKQGKPIQYSIHTGYNKALTSIIDANITTIITSIVLYLIGTGSIKGFAITTIIGVITSMFTSIVGTRAIVNLIYGRKRIEKLSI